MPKLLTAAETDILERISLNFRKSERKAEVNEEVVALKEPKESLNDLVAELSRKLDDHERNAMLNVRTV